MKQRQGQQVCSQSSPIEVKRQAKGARTTPCKKMNGGNGKGMGERHNGGSLHRLPAELDGAQSELQEVQEVEAVEAEVIPTGLDAR